MRKVGFEASIGSCLQGAETWQTHEGCLHMSAVMENIHWIHLESKLLI